MRKLLSCVLMMTLLLAGCGGQQAESDSPEQLTTLIRGEYLSLAGWTGQVEVTAQGEDYPIPQTVTIRGSLTAEQREALTRAIETDFAIPAQRQIYESGGTT